MTFKDRKKKMDGEEDDDQGGASGGDDTSKLADATSDVENGNEGGELDTAGTDDDGNGGTDVDDTQNREDKDEELDDEGRKKKGAPMSKATDTESGETADPFVAANADEFMAEVHSYINEATVQGITAAVPMIVSAVVKAIDRREGGLLTETLSRVEEITADLSKTFDQWTEYNDERFDKVEGQYVSLSKALQPEAIRKAFGGHATANPDEPRHEPLAKAKTDLDATATPTKAEGDTTPVDGKAFSKLMDKAETLQQRVQKAVPGLSDAVDAFNRGGVTTAIQKALEQGINETEEQFKDAS